MASAEADSILAIDVPSTHVLGYFLASLRD